MSSNSTSNSAGGENPFELPRTITRQLKKCVNAYTGKDPAYKDTVQYLWIDLTGRGAPHGGAAAQPAKSLAPEEWLNVVDEAASLGVHCLLVRVGDSLSAYPDVWTICQWAQGAHGMLVGLHTNGRSLTEEDVEQLRQLDPERACLFVDRATSENMHHLEKHNIRLCAADVDEEDHTPPCSMPECMVFVGAEGKLYTCGLVLGDRNFCFGSVLDKRLEEVLKDDSLPRSIPADVPHHGRCCDGCPPIMAKRVMEHFG